MKIENWGKTQYRTKCDQLAKKITLTRNRRCEICNRPANTAHHVFPKSRCSILRYDIDNLVAICNSCHYKHHTLSDPTIHGIIREYRGEGWWDELKEKAKFNKDHKINLGYYKRIYKQLKKHEI